VKKTDRVKALERLIVKYQKSYYDSEAEISDAEFDMLWDELKNSAPESQILKKVGTGKDPVPGADGFPKAKHIIPMGSQEKAENPEKFRAWAAKIQAVPGAESGAVTFLVQHKLDGASLELQYEKGVLIRAVTRGDGVTGDEITANARAMKGVKKELAEKKFSGGVRGEVVMTRDMWKKKYSGKANCRNAANGIMRRKDGQGCGDLKLITYDASALNYDDYFTTEKQKIAWLKKQGFEVTTTKEFSDPKQIIAYRAEVASGRDRLPVDIDGLVIKVPEIDMADLRRARPEKQIAFKFELETAFSVLRSVEWSESGTTYTPIGVVDPVRLAGTTVQRANLNNPDMIRAMDLKIGSVVRVVKRGEIIPKIEGLAPEGAAEALAVPGEKSLDIEFPSVCSACGSNLVDGGTRLYCPSSECPKRLHHRLEKWVSVLDIRELGDKLIRQLFEKKRVVHIADLYTLKAEELAEYDRMGELSAAKVIRHIQEKREISLAAFIAGFDFEGVGELIMEKAAAAGFNTLEKLRTAPAEDLAEVYGLGEITAQVIHDGLKETNAHIDAVLAAGVISIAPPPKAEDQPLKGLSFCFTGELKSMKRPEAEEKIKALGASAKSTVVKDLSYLVTNDPGSGSAKNKKAGDLGVKIIDEARFLALLADPGLAANTTREKPAAKTTREQGELF
jgi:DNA ligase (NAD+)